MLFSYNTKSVIIVCVDSCHAKEFISSSLSCIQRPYKSILDETLEDSLDQRKETFLNFVVLLQLKTPSNIPIYDS